ncbi:MAG: GcrA family cell cycle regulator, partial [Pseudomonadota bacterium]
MSWTDERVEKLKELWTEGMSASQIAKVLGGVTRNAVIGKVHRLGLSNRAGGDEAKTAEAPKAKPASAAPKPAAEPVKPTAPEPVKADAPVPAPVVRRTAPVIRDATQPRAPGAPTPEEEAARATLAEIEKFAKRIPLLDLTERTCKWPGTQSSPQNAKLSSVGSPIGH